MIYIFLNTATRSAGLISLGMRGCTQCGKRTKHSSCKSRESGVINISIHSIELRVQTTSTVSSLEYFSSYRCRGDFSPGQRVQEYRIQFQGLLKGS